MTATMQLTRTEGRLFARDPAMLFFGLVFPGLLLVMLGWLYPGFTDPAPELDGASYLVYYAPVTMAMGVATLALMTLPPILGTYRQFGILRRLQTTPVHPARLLGAQVAVHLVVAVVAAAATVAIAAVGFDIGMPARPIWFALVYVLGAASMFAMGVLVGSRARRTSSAQAIGMALFFPMLLFAGVWIPRSVMPDALLTISDLTPLGATVQALGDAWAGSAPSMVDVTVIALWTIGVGLLAVRLFRWE